MKPTRTLLLLLSAAALVAAIPWQRADGQVVSYPFNGNANDATGNGINGTVIGATLTDDRFGNANSAYMFNGVSDYIQASNSTKYRFNGTTDFSISAWVKFCTKQPRGTNAAGPYVVGMGKATTNLGTTTTDYGYALTIPADNRGGFYHTKSSGIPTFEIGGAGLDDGKWHHIVGVTNVNTNPVVSSVYVDGVLVFSHFDGGHDYTASTLALVIGKNLVDNSYFKGAIDDIRIYTSALSTAEVLGLYGENGWTGTSPAIGANITLSSVTPLCVGDSVQLLVQTSGPVRRIVWRSADGLRLKDSTNPTPYVLPKQTTTYGLDIYSAGPCEESQSRSVTVTVNESPKLTPGGVKYLCPGDSVTIGAPATGGGGGYIYTWTPATGLSSTTAAAPRASPKTSMRYYVTVVDRNGCASRDSTQVLVFDLPKFSLGADTTICRGSPVTLDAQPAATDNYKFAWSPKAGLNDSTIARPEATPDQTTQYIVTVTGSTGCIARDTIVVRVNEPPTVDAGADLTLCGDSSAVIGRKTGETYTYSWSPATGLSDAKVATPVAKPSATTTYTLTVTDAVGCTAVDQVIVTVVKPVVAVDRSTLDFQQLDGCTSSRELTLILTNTGDADLTIDEATVDNTAFGIVSPGLPFDLKKGEQASVVIRFSPSGAGMSTGKLVVRGKVAGVSCIAEISVDLSGEKLQALVAADVSRVDFGRTLVCEQVVRDTTITIRNNGSASVTIAPGTVIAPFSVVSPTAAQTVVAGGTLEVTVRYVPGAAGSYLADLKLPYESGACRDTIRVTLAGQHEAPSLTATAAVDFGALSGCETSRDTTITLTNGGTMAIDLTEAQLPAGFRLTGGVPTTIPPGESRIVSVRFEPATTGTAGGGMIVTYEPCGLQLVMALSGVKQGVSFSTPDTLDFGSIVSCAEATKTLTLNIGYSGDGVGDGSIGAVTVNGPFTTTLAVGAALPNGTPEPFEVRFEPTGDGVVTGWIDVMLEPCGVNRRIELRGERRTATLVAQGPVSFGTQPSGTTPSRDVIFSNTGTTVLHVDRIEGLTAPFMLESTQPPLPADIPPGGTVTARVRYTVNNGARSSAIRAVADVPCSLTAETTVDGVGEAGALAAITLPMVTAAAGDRLHLPLILTSSTGLDIVGATKFEATISFDRTMLVAVDRSAATEDAVKRRVKVTGQRTVGSDTLGFAELIAVFGKAERTELKLEEFRWIDAQGDVVTTTSDGELELQGICREGGVRLYDPAGEVVLKPVIPNPVRGVVEIGYEVVENGSTRLSVVDMQGKHVATIVQGELSPGEYVAWFDTRGMASGVYYCVLETPTLVLSQRMEVAR